MADQFAANGYYTIIVDVFNGDPLPMPKPDSLDLFQWLAEGSDGKNPHTKEAVDPIVVTGIKWLKEQGFKKIGAMGYCFGAKVCLPGSSHRLRGIDHMLTHRLFSTSPVTSRRALTSATLPTPLSSTRRSLPPSLAPCPSPPPRPTPSSPPRSATSLR